MHLYCPLVQIMNVRTSFGIPFWTHLFLILWESIRLAPNRKNNLKVRFFRSNPVYPIKLIYLVDTPGRCIFDMDDNSLTLGGDLPDLPLEPQIKDQVTVIFNKLRAEKREAELAKNLLPDIGKFI